ncbi:MAG: restriction endonuclease [Rhizobacter sp.]|nr:restriction endonuclease [Rhizobacter sp.]
MSHPSRPGKDLEKLVASLEKALGHQGAVRVESPAFLKDRVTGEQREHDVLLIASSGHHITRIAAECRDRSRKVTVNEIEAFFAKCQDTGIHQGVVVSSRGFTKTALSKAQHLGIRTLGLTDVESFNWLGTSGVTGTTRQVKHVSWLFEPEEHLESLPSKYTVLTATGNPVEPELLIAAARNEFKKIPHESTPPPDGVKTIIFPTPDLTIRDEETNSLHTVKRAVVDVHYEILTEFVPFRLVSYIDNSSGERITDAAVADMKLGSVPGKFVIVYKEEEGGQVVFIPEKRADA